MSTESKPSVSAVRSRNWHVLEHRANNFPKRLTVPYSASYYALLSLPPFCSSPHPPLGLSALFMERSSGLRSPPPPRSNAASPRPRFDSDLLKAYMKKLLSSTLQSKTWAEAKDRERLKMWTKEIGERVKERMVEIQPRGLYVTRPLLRLCDSDECLPCHSCRYSKYVVLTQIHENLSQGGR
jgi:ferredoxin-like protein FixX